MSQSNAVLAASATQTGALASWDVPSRVILADGTDAQVTESGAGTGTNIIIAYGFASAAVPPNAVIQGITVTARIRQLNDGDAAVNSVKLYSGTTALSSNRASQYPGALPADTVITFGGVADLWGATLTQGDISSPVFGVGLDFLSSAGPGAIGIDYITMGFTWAYPGSGMNSRVGAALVSEQFGGRRR